MAMTGSGQPMLRRVASSSATISTVPITTSSGSGLPTRNIRSWKIHGMYSTEAATATASTQSNQGTPPGFHRLEGWARFSSAARCGNTRKIRPSTKARCTPRWVISCSSPKPAV